MTAVDDATSQPMALADRFRSEASALCHTLDELDKIQRDAWRRESEVARKAIDTLQADLALAAAEAKAEGAHSREELEKALDDLAEAWRGRLEDLRVRTHLAEMNARDVVERVRSETQRPVAEARAAVLDAMRDLRSSFEDTLRAVRGFAEGEPREEAAS